MNFKKPLGLTERGRAMVFMGTYEHTLDAKGRMFVPAKHRDGLGEKIVIFKWILEDCLYMMSEDAFAKFTEDLDNMPKSDEDANRIERVLFPSAVTVELDAQNRVLIPADLRRYANLEKDVAVVGVRTRVELWDLEAWRRRSQMDTNQAKGSITELKNKGYKF